MRSCFAAEPLCLEYGEDGLELFYGMRSGLDGDVDWDRFSLDTFSTIDLSCASLRVKVSWLALSSRCKNWIMASQ